MLNRLPSSLKERGVYFILSIPSEQQLSFRLVLFLAAAATTAVKTIAA